MNFKSVEKKYRPIPFWSWNEKLDVETTKRQVEIMNDAGIGGFFMHARGGLATEYMGKEWFDNVHAASELGRKLDMYPWAYDENGWPSGFGAGRVNGLGIEYQQKHLHCEKLTEENKDAPGTLLVKDGYRYYYLVNEFYVDCLDKKVIAKFIEEIYAEYARQCGDEIEGFFTDEPQISRFSGHPWSFILEDEYKKKYGTSLIERLDELFFEKGDYANTRVNFYKLVTELFSESFFKQIYDWCTEHGYGLTGHLVIEENLLAQIAPSGACMPHYEYFTIPGMDWLCRPVFDCLTPLALGSAAAQLGKKQVLSETYAAAGHNISHGELKRIYEWQMVHGINLLCTHLEGYSLRGIRKRDYPPAMYYQQPWWRDMDIFFDSMSRIGKLLSEGRIEADVLLLHPQSAAWIMFNGLEGENREQTKAAIRKLNADFLADIRRLEDKHVAFHLGDEILMERHGRVEGKSLRIGEMSYTKVVIPRGMHMLPSTLRLIEEYRKAGGEIVSIDEIPANPITEENRLSYTKRSFDDFDMHYFVNTDNAEICATFSVGDKVLDIESGELHDFYGSHTFAPYESLVIIDTGEHRAKAPEHTPKTELKLEGVWSVKSSSFNSITLDICDYSLDGGDTVRGANVLDILPRINEYRRPVKLWHSFVFYAKDIPEKIYLCTETPEIFDIKLNGKTVDKTDCGSFRDDSFRLLDISGLVRQGKNRIEFESVICQSEKTYEHLSNSWEFESMKNSLSYDMEVEQIYLVGEFGAQISSDIKDAGEEAYIISAPPAVAKMPSEVDIARLDLSGFPEFAGELCLSREFDIEDTDRYVVLEGRGLNSVHIAVNGEHVATRMFPPYRVDISAYLRPGKNNIELRIVNNLRNMQGPFHRGAEIHLAAPESFYRESNVFRAKRGADESCHDVFDDYYDDYCLVKFGLGELS